MQFNELGLAAPILKALEGEGYTTPTPIQAQAIPAVLEGKDLLGIAQTGTGKTAAFALPILTLLAQTTKPPMRKGCRALVLSPTRELASQIAASFRTYGKFMGLKVAVIFGGVDIRKQIQNLAGGVDVIVATPGRLLDHVGERTVDLSGTEIFVLDEADQMLDMGFVKPIRQIASRLSRRRQNLFFSATMPKEIAGLADELLNPDPVKVSVTPVSKTADRVEQKIIFVEARKKRALLVELFGDQSMERTLVFTRTKRGADRVARHLELAGINASAIHGNKSQRQREKALEAFKRSDIKVLVATDIAARGIDIDNVSHVVNYELPEVPEAYVHRIGRTARAGASGQAISLCDAAERDLLRNIERITRQKIPSEDRRGDDTLESQPEPQRSRNGGSSGRPERSQRSGRPPQHARGRGRNEEGRSNGEGNPRPANRQRVAHGDGQVSERHAVETVGARPERRPRDAEGDRGNRSQRPAEANARRNEQGANGGHRKGPRPQGNRGNGRGERDDRYGQRGERRGASEFGAEGGRRSGEARGERTERGEPRGEHSSRSERPAQWNKAPRRDPAGGREDRSEGGRDGGRGRRNHAGDRQTNGNASGSDRPNRNHRGGANRQNPNRSKPQAQRPVSFGADI